MELFKYNKLYDDKKPLIKIWILILSFIGICLLILYSIDYTSYYSNRGVIISDNYLKIYVDENDLYKISNNSKLKIENKNFAYTIKSISDILFNSTYYIEVILEMNLDDKINVKNNIIDFKILLDKKTILEYIIYKIGG